MPQPYSTILNILDIDKLPVESTDDDSSLSEDEDNEPEVQSLTLPATIPQKHKRGPKAKSLL